MQQTNNEPPLHFTLDEYALRLAKTRQAMDKANVELLIVSDPSNMAWLTGYDGWSFYTHQAVLVGISGEPIWWGRAMDALGARRTVYMSTDNITGYPDEYVQNPVQHPMQTLAKLILERGWGSHRIGLEMDNYYFSAAAWESLQANLPDAKFLDATGLVNWQRAIKSEAELEYMRRAARIVEAMHQMDSWRKLSRACPRMSW